MNDNFSDLMEVGYDVLAHHGIKGQRWGKQNGPPYPLNSEGREKFKKQVKKFKEAAKKKLNKKIESDKKYRIIEKQKRAEKRRRKILNDPKKLYKHKDEFTTDEIYDAIDKLRSVNQLVDEAGLDQKPAKKQKEVKLSKKQKRMADSYASLLANYDKFSPEELELAKKRAGERSWLGDKTQEKVLNRLEIIPSLADKGARSIYSVKSGIKSIKDLKDDLTISGLRSGESHALWLGQQKDDKTGKSWAELLGETYSAQRGTRNEYENEATRTERYKQRNADRKAEKEQARLDDLNKWRFEQDYKRQQSDRSRQDRLDRQNQIDSWMKDEEDALMNQARSIIDDWPTPPKTSSGKNSSIKTKKYHDYQEELRIKQDQLFNVERELTNLRNARYASNNNSGRRRR